MRKSALRRKKPLRSRSTPQGTRRPKKRSASEFQRVYGSRARVQWVKSLPCIVCHGGPCENAHTENGGMGRKADANTIVPLCGFHHWESHTLGVETFQRLHEVNLAWYAAKTDELWRSRSTEAA